MNDIAIRVEHLGKRYRLGGPRAAYNYKTLRESLISAAKTPLRWLQGQKTGRDNNFWALDDVSFEVKHGEAVGIIGRNGAGKSTLLKVLSRITKPTRGRAELFGRVGSLLEVGTGFHAELTGRENIFLNGAILGMRRREIGRRFDEIVEFAGVAKFLDTPVKFYSSGMYVRLAFAVAAHLEPEILVVDEVLAVGDAEFQKKSLGKMEAAAKQGRTVLFVSHQMNAIKALCSHSLLLSNGRVAAYGDTEQVVSTYMNWNEQSEWNANTAGQRIESPYFAPSRISLIDADREPVRDIASADQTVGVLVEGEVEMLNRALQIGFAVYASTGELLFWSLHTDAEEGNWIPLRIGRNRIVGWIPPHFLNEGDYRIELFLNMHYSEWISQPGMNAPSIHLHVRGGLSKSPYWMMPRPGLNAPVLKFEVLN